jgi:3,4-dihydroxy 2-butanone 4-phosphate synthase/GTP cyclohydrolase II
MSDRFATIKEALFDIKRGRMIIVVDEPNRENEGDLVMAAEKITPEAINFMIRYGRGLVCVPMEENQLNRLGLEQMSPENREAMKTAFTVSCDAAPRFGITTGISAADRAKTVKVLIGEKAKPEDLVRPGHIFPLRAVPGGVLRRAGHTEAAVDLAGLAGFKKAGVICEIIKDDGQMARLPDLIRFARRHGLRIITIEDLIRYRLKKEKLIQLMATSQLPTRYGIFEIRAYQNILDGQEHLALIMGSVKGAKNVLVRVHSECATGDVFNSLKCDCGEQLQRALSMIAREKCGVFLYMRQEGRGIGLINKIRAYALQDKGLDTVEANEKLGFPPDLRDYGIGAQILADIGLSTIKLITNNPFKIVGLEGYGLKIKERVALVVKPNQHNICYLKTKSKKLGHLLPV